MTKSKAMVGAPVALVINRDTDGVATNIPEYLAAKKALEQKRPKDVYKDHQKDTAGCLICKEFSKYRSDCPTCGRSMINFGRNVKNPKKGSKVAWNQFIEAYAWRIYDVVGKETFPCPDIAKFDDENAYGIVRRVIQREHRASRKVLLTKWVRRFDKHIEQHRK